MSLRKLLCLPLVALLFVSTALASLPPPSASIVGMWDFKLDVTYVVGRDGILKKVRRFYKWEIRFRQNGNELTGELLGGQVLRVDGGCTGAAIEGSINEGRVQFTVTYQGVCCKDEKMTFVGRLGEDGTSLTGILEPKDAPKNDSCSLAYADVKATKW